MAKRPLVRVATPASRPVTYSPGPPWRIGQATLGRHLPANVIDLLPFQRSDGLTRDGNSLSVVHGVARLHQPLGTPIEGILHLLAEPRLGQRCPFVGGKLPIQPGRAVAADLPFKDDMPSLDLIQLGCLQRSGTRAIADSATAFVIRLKYAAVTVPLT
jgi:hypothetical protein